MRKDHLRDYATAAFVEYARRGGTEQYRQEKYNELLFLFQRQDVGASTGTGDPVAAAHVRAEAEMEAAEIKSIIADLQAVETTLEVINWLRSGPSILQALRLVYFSDPSGDVDGDIIRERVHRAGLSIPASESQVYRWLADARTIFSKVRGLRLSERQQASARKLGA